MKKIRKTLAMVLVLAMALTAILVPASAEDTLDSGTYDIGDYISLSLYINAMGGIDFAEDLLDGASLTVDGNGNATLTMQFDVSQTLTIYTVPCHAFIDARNSTPGYYDADGALHDAAYTTATVDSRGNTATDSDGNENVPFVYSMTIPVDTDTDEVVLWVYLESNVMGVQFCDGTGSGASNNPGVSTSYKGSVSIDWEGFLSGATTGGTSSGTPDETSTQNSTITYTYYNTTEPSNTYEVNIPATISLGSGTSADYTVTANNFDLKEGAYVTVSAPSSGTLSSDSSAVTYTNTLAADNLTRSGQTLPGNITLSSEATASGTYSGTLTFTIDFYAG